MAEGENLNTGQIERQASGLCRGSKSLGRAPKPYFSTRVVSLVQSGSLKLVYGDEATPDFYDGLNIRFGDSEPAVIDALQPGYTYRWYVESEVLVVTDGTGTLVKKRRVETWSDLAVEAAVLESRQFEFYIDPTRRKENLIATRHERTEPAYAQVWVWGEFDRYLRGAYHVYFKRLCEAGHGEEVWSDKARVKEIEEAQLQSILCALVRMLDAAGRYPAQFYVAEKPGGAKLVRVSRRGMVAGFGKYLMLHLFAAGLLSGDKPCYEPWMLWQLWKWTGSYRVPVFEEKIFDLSPWWGA